MRCHSPTKLATYHPVVLEGPGGHDQRNPALVAEQLCEILTAHWSKRPTTKPKILLTQGDPIERTGISAVTREVANKLGIPRALVCIDENIAGYHARDADRENVILEFRYSQLEAVVAQRKGPVAEQLKQNIDRMIAKKNARRAELEKPPLKSYFPEFARLQEFTKTAARHLCGEITVAHTQSKIYEFSISSFYTASLELGLMDKEDMAAPDFGAFL